MNRALCARRACVVLYGCEMKSLHAGVLCAVFAALLFDHSNKIRTRAQYKRDYTIHDAHIEEDAEMKVEEKKHIDTQSIRISTCWPIDTVHRWRNPLRCAAHPRPASVRCVSCRSCSVHASRVTRARHRCCGCCDFGTHALLARISGKVTTSSFHRA